MHMLTFFIFTSVMQTAFMASFPFTTDRLPCLRVVLLSVSRIILLLLLRSQSGPSPAPPQVPQEIWSVRPCGRLPGSRCSGEAEGPRTQEHSALLPLILLAASAPPAATVSGRLCYISSLSEHSHFKLNLHANSRYTPYNATTAEKYIRSLFITQ